MLIPINIEARIEEKEFKGLSLRRAYYTAAYVDGEAERSLGSGNYAHTYIADAKPLGVHELLMIRTAGLSLDPKIFTIDSIEEDKSMDIVNRDNAHLGSAVFDLYHVDFIDGFDSRWIKKDLGLGRSENRSYQHPLLEQIKNLQPSRGEKT